MLWPFLWVEKNKTATQQSPRAHAPSGLGRGSGAIAKASRRAAARAGRGIPAASEQGAKAFPPSLRHARIVPRAMRLVHSCHAQIVVDTGLALVLYYALRLGLRPSLNRGPGTCSTQR